MWSRNGSRLIIICLLMFTILLPLGVQDVSATPAAWSIEVVDSEGDVGRGVSLALDSLDRPHISYFDNTGGIAAVKYAWWDGSAWQIDTVDTLDAQLFSFETSLALDSSNLPHITYSDFIEPNWHIRYAKWTGIDWDIETILMDEDSLHVEALVLDTNDHPHLVYTTINADVWYTRWTGLEWVYELVDTMLESGMDLALDSLGYAHISYYASPSMPGPTILRSAQKTDTGWLVETIDETPSNGFTTSIALDPAGKPRISYGGGVVGVMYAEWTGTIWSLDSVDTNYQESSLALDSSDRPHIAYYEQGGDLKYAWETIEEWVIETVDVPPQVDWTYVKLALDSTDHAHIAYYDSHEGQLKYARAPDESIRAIEPTTFDSNSDGYDDAVTVMIEADTSHTGGVLVSANVSLIDPSGVYIQSDTLSWQIIDGADDAAGNTFYVPLGGTYGWYDLEVVLYDDMEMQEDYQYLSDAVELYPPEILELVITVTGSGTTAPPPGTYVTFRDYEEDIIAHPDPGWILDHWTVGAGTYVGPVNPLRVVMAGDHTVTAFFVEATTPTRDLTIGVQGSGTTDPASIIHTYPLETVVTVTATPDTGWRFEHWLFDDAMAGSVNPIDVTMDDAHTLVAVFVASSGDDLPLQIEVSGSGTTQPSPGMHTYPRGEDLVVTALPDPGWQLAHWLFDGIQSGAQSTITVTMDSDHAVVAVFTPLDDALKTLVIETGGAGTTEPGLGSHLFPDGTEVLVEAIPDAGWRFDHWMLEDVNIGTENPVSIRMDINQGLTAIFLEMSGPVDEEPPVADAGDAQTISANTMVSFDAAASTDDVGIVEYHWDFGDGTTGTGPTVTHTYAAVGSYTVTLTVTDAAGNSDTDTLTITVTEDNARPAFTSSGLTIDPSSVDAGGTVSISLEVTNTGTRSGTHEVILMIDGMAEEEKTVNLNPDETATVSFEVSAAQEGSYSIDVNGLTGSYTVTKPSRVIPGFPYNSIVLGLVFGVLVLWLIQRRK